MTVSLVVTIIISALLWNTETFCRCIICFCLIFFNYSTIFFEVSQSNQKDTYEPKRVTHRLAKIFQNIFQRWNDCNYFETRSWQYYILRVYEHLYHWLCSCTCTYIYCMYVLILNRAFSHDVTAAILVFTLFCFCSF